MERKEFLKLCGLSASAFILPFGNINIADNTKRPNVLFIMSDDHAEGAISCYGSKLINTPNIDRIAKEGVKFQNSFVTNSICGPSRAVLLTGKYSHLNGFKDNLDKFDGSQQTFPKLLKNEGYQTGMFGKWHLKSEPTGFDSWKVLIDQGEYYNPTLLENGEEKEHIGYTTDIITDIALDELENRDNEKPFCYFVHHKAPHRNWMPNPKYFDVFEDEELPIPETFYDNYKGRKAAEFADMRIENMFLSLDLKLKADDIKYETGTGGNSEFASKVIANWEREYNRLTPEQKAAWDKHYDKVRKEYRDSKLEGDELLRWKYQRYIKDYLRCILSVDESVGRLLDYLDENNLRENTIVVYTSDQGFYLGEHGWYDKRFMYEESLSMPLLMRYPEEIPAGSVNENLVLNLDFAPTFLDYAGVSIPDDMQGKTLRKLISNGKLEWRNSIYYHYYEFPHGWHNVYKHFGVRTDQYKLIYFYGDENFWEFYDLESDPNELHNLYGRPEYSDQILNLKRELIRLQTKYEDKNGSDILANAAN
ncbi:MAG: sulfatase [Melioribacteraceae bacterium]|nr:sulfatase [Melioribacteraceae bacterium]MCF8264825.1 sulfatase [Melioribacteraceae bacterium]MCF8432593.1 sulfatase [Melioribacteraceae bacterium]